MAKTLLLESVFKNNDYLADIFIFQSAWIPVPFSRCLGISGLNQKEIAAANQVDVGRGVAPVTAPPAEPGLL